MYEYLCTGLSHIGIVTDDPEKCAAFYVEHLGFRRFYHKTLGKLEIEFVENGGCVIEFVGSGAKEGAGSLAHIALTVQGIGAMVGALKAAGVIAQDAKIGEMPGFFPSGAKNIFFTGPAGESIELFEYCC